MRLRVVIEPQEGASYEEQLTSAGWAEELGFDGFFRTDHLLPLGLGGAKRTASASDTWTTLAGIARETTQIRLGTLVSAATFRLPGPFAAAVAHVDAMSGGRIELGLGAGWFEAEHVAFGVPFPGVVERFDRLEEQLEILTAYAKTKPGETFTHQGVHYQLVECPAMPRPAQKDGVPLIVGGKGKPRGLTLAARFASEYNLEFPRPGAVVATSRRLRETCDAIERDRRSLRFSAAHLACVGRDVSDLRGRAERAGLNLGIDLGGLIGTVNDIRSRLDQLENEGLDTFYLQVPDLHDRAHFELLAELI